MGHYKIKKPTHHKRPKIMIYFLNRNIIFFIPIHILNKIINNIA